MGLVKYNNQTLSIPEVPDGMVIMQESEVGVLRAQANDFLGLKSKIPVGLDVSQLSTVIEKGQRYDAAVAEQGSLKAKVTELETNIAQFSNLPKDFKPEKWNNYVQQEQSQIRAGKLTDLTNKVREKVKTEMKIDAIVDPRFIDQAKLQAFDPDAEGAFDKWYGILDEAHTAQQEFVSNKALGGTPPPEPPGGLGGHDNPPHVGGTPGDRASEGGVKLQGF